MPPRKKSVSPPESRSLSQQLEREQASRAYRKVMSGETPTAQERSALKRYEKEQEEQKRWQYYESIPQKHWRQMSGRQTKVINEQAERYGIPFGGRTISLSNVVRALHEFLAANARRLLEDDDDMLQSVVSSPALERYREERAQLARLDRLERERTLISRGEIRTGLGQIAGILRTAGETLQSQFGTEAVTILNDALDDAEHALEQLCGELEDEDVSATDEGQP
ncbi:hypothetical protein KOR42_34540 [Thalassoglobus neptunius]|uniref:Uncharacterized protein n=1 Tax=Thalassoglobus neptunius TaxID=1938619 RepID=A0A5C5WMB6_9PLAN|nr:hypothetical protein [Thalassoglobus neptunius]TWT51767.1 hypothetical protein KOR42_34540 [Thalassoglobus neptunius]